MGLRPLAVALALSCVLALVVVRMHQLPSATPQELEVRTRSAGYYTALAAADGFDVRSASPSKARLQQLSLAQTGGKLSSRLIRACSKGDDEACAEIANNPSKFSALKRRTRHPRWTDAQLTREQAMQVAPVVETAMPKVVQGKPVTFQGR